MQKMFDILCTLLMVLCMSLMGCSRLFVPDWDRGLEGCPVPSFENVKVKLRSGGRFAIYKCKNKRRFVQIEGPTMSLCLRGK